MRWPFRKAIPPVEGSRPEALVRQFCTEYTAWNARAMSRSDDHPDIMSEYTALVARFAPDAAPMLPSWGTESTFDPRNIEISDTRRGGETATVVVKMWNRVSKTPFSQVFEFDLREGSAGWRIVQVFYLDEYDGNRRLPYL